MRRPSLLIALAAVALVTSVVYGQRPPTAPDPSGYVGSEACRQCHEAEYTTWKKNLHVQMTKPVAEARVEGDFRAGTALRHEPRAYTMESRDGRYFISISRRGKPAERFEVHYTLGARRFQGYLSRLPDGRIYVLPVFWHNESQRWLDFEEITPIPKDSAHDLRQIWNVSCVNCHATNLVRNFDPAKNTFATTWTEMGIGCEACHGPGRAHIADTDHLKIFTMKKVPPRQIFDACGYCHGNKTNVFLGFKPGDRYDDYAVPFLISEPIPDNDPQGDFWPDGRPSRFNRPQALTLTGCFQKGEATCTSCHRMHGAENSHSLKVEIEQRATAMRGTTPASEDGLSGGHTRESDQLCTQCHGAESFGAAHTHHRAESQGSRCINCHMSDVNWRLITRRLDHTFQPPTPEMTAQYGVPNACTSCHEDRSPEWAIRQMDQWYGNGARRRAVVSLADTMYRAGTGDTTVLPDVAKLAVNRSNGALIRASAAEFAGQLIAKSQMRSPDHSRPLEEFGTEASRMIVNALVGAASDSEPWVRITAVRTLGLFTDPRAESAVAAHLTDVSRVVRVRAAEALMNQGILTLEGMGQRVLASVQDEWVESLRTFGDIAAHHATIGWLLAARGNSEQATKELQLGASMDPNDARPHVYLWSTFGPSRPVRPSPTAVQIRKIYRSFVPEFGSSDCRS